MKLVLVKPRGFCAGVKRAIEIVEKALDLFGPPIYIKHQIVHNEHVIKRLEKRGAIFVEDIKNIAPSSKIIYSAHGVSKEVKNQVLKQNLIEIDATCPLVSKIHHYIKKYSKEGYKIVLIGHNKHVEIKSAKSYALGDIFVVENKEDVEKLNVECDSKLFYISQTTFSLDDIEEIVFSIKNKFPNSFGISSICFATTNRQNALKSCLKDADLVLVVGDKKSSNSNRLCDIAKNRNVKAFLINDKKDIEKDLFEKAKKVVITSGASTPEYVLDDCVDKICKIKDCKIEEVIHKKENIVFSSPKINIENIN